MLSVKYAANLRKMQLLRRTQLKKNSLKEDQFCFNQNQDTMQTHRQVYVGIALRLNLQNPGKPEEKIISVGK